MGERSRVLVVDDEPVITELLGVGLRAHGFEVLSAADGLAALRAATEFVPHVVILDVMLPDLDGFEVCRRLRAQGVETPVIFLTASDATESKVNGLAIGGDDYVTKPFSFDELLARLRAALRRSRLDRGGAERLEVGDLSLDDDLHEVRRGDVLVDLTPTEYKVLRYLLSNARRVVSKAQIADHVWQYDFGGDPNLVETYISNLRKKIDGVDPPLIHTVRGVGYSLRLPRR